MADFLTEMARASRERASLAQAASPLPTEEHLPVYPLNIDRDGFSLIAETKLAGPAAGRLVPVGDDQEAVVDLARSYVAGGASVVSVLTEPLRFDGSLSHLRSVAAAVTVPVMRKDFLVDPVQVIEARGSGASGVLLIARILTAEQLVEMVETARGLGMFSLVEVFDEADLEVASSAFSLGVMVGVNSRDLTDLSVDPGRFARLGPLIPEDIVSVAESGIETPADVEIAVDLGYRVVLVGSALSASDDPLTATTRLVEAGRRAAKVVVR